MIERVVLEDESCIMSTPSLILIPLPPQPLPKPPLRIKLPVILRSRIGELNQTQPPSNMLSRIVIRCVLPNEIVAAARMLMM